VIYKSGWCLVYGSRYGRHGGSRFNKTTTTRNTGGIKYYANQHSCAGSLCGIGHGASGRASPRGGKARNKAILLSVRVGECQADRKATHGCLVFRRAPGLERQEWSAFDDSKGAFRGLLVSFGRFILNVDIAAGAGGGWDANQPRARLAPPAGVCLITRGRSPLTGCDAGTDGLGGGGEAVLLFGEHAQPLC
jgi:hypothetical protein